jgi:ribosomal protein S18 acetylase RimI-like enzyme
MKNEAYQRTLLNVRAKNGVAIQLYHDTGYQTGDESFAYVKDLGI